MWSKLRKKVVKPEKKEVDVDNPDGKVILQKFDRIPSYVGDVSEPIDWHLPPSCGSPIPNGHHGMRPLSTFTTSYSPKLPCRRSLSSFETEESRHNIELDLEGSPDSDDNLFFNNDHLSKETNGDHVSNGNDRGQSNGLCNHNSFSSMATPTLPKKDKKYERVVTNNQVVKEQRKNSPARRKKSDLPPVSIPDKKERRALINGDRNLSSTTSEHRLSSGPSTATSDNVFDLEVQFERQESGYATLDDQASSGDKSSNIGDRCDLFTSSPEAVSAPTTPGMRDLFFNPSDVAGEAKPSSDPFRIYPTFRKQVSSGNNNTEVVSATVAATKPTNLDINQNLNQSGRMNIETTVEIHPEPLGDDKGEYYPADSSISRIYRKDRRKGDDRDLGSSVEDLYASVPKGIQRLSADEGNGTASSESSRSSKIEDEESVAESESTVKTNETSGTLLASDEDVGDDDVIGDDLDDGIELDLDIDSEDNDVAPPIPEKNYRLLNEGTLMRETVGKRSTGKGSGSESDVNPAEDVNEPTHMSWDEVMTEARNLGIPWSKPESVKTDSDRFTDTDTCDGMSSVASSEVLSSRSEPPSASHNRRLQLTTEVKHEKKRSPFKDKFKFQSLFSKKSKDRHSSDSSLHKYTTMGSSSASSNSKKRSSTPTHPIAPSSLGSPVSNPGCVCSPRSSRMKVPRSPAHHHSSITLPRDISGSTASWGSTNSCFQTRSLSVSHQSTTSLSSAQSSSSSAYGPQNMMSVSMMASIPSHNIHDGPGSSLSPTTPTKGSNADFIDSLWKLKDCGWYWGPMSWDDAESKLSNKPDGSFMVRDSSDDRYILSLSFRSQSSTHHTRIEHYKGMFSFYSQPKSHGAATIVEFIEKAMEHSRSGKFLYFLRPRAPGLPPAPVQLLFPVSRFRNMHSLHHLCRFQILKHTRKDLIDRLPIPPRLKEYLKQSQYYTEYCADDPFLFQRY